MQCCLSYSDEGRSLRPNSRLLADLRLSRATASILPVCNQTQLSTKSSVCRDRGGRTAQKWQSRAYDQGRCSLASKHCRKAAGQVAADTGAFAEPPAAGRTKHTCRRQEVFRLAFSGLSILQDLINAARLDECVCEVTVIQTEGRRCSQSPPAFLDALGKFFHTG